VSAPPKGHKSRIHTGGMLDIGAKARQGEAKHTQKGGKEKKRTVDRAGEGVTRFDPEERRRKKAARTGENGNVKENS